MTGLPQLRLQLAAVGCQSARVASTTATLPPHGDLPLDTLTHLELALIAQRAAIEDALTHVRRMQALRTLRRDREAAAA